jgi:hypothetical protein
LVDAQPSQILIVGLGVFFCFEVTVLESAVGNGAADAMDELFNGVFPLAGVDVAVKILADDNFCGQLTPVFGYFGVFLSNG